MNLDLFSQGNAALLTKRLAGGPVASARRADAIGVGGNCVSPSAEVAWKDFSKTAWGELFCFCPAARMPLSDWPACYHPEHGRRRSLRHSWSRNNRRAVLGTCSDGGWEHPVQLHSNSTCGSRFVSTSSWPFWSHVLSRFSTFRKKTERYVVVVILMNKKALFYPQQIYNV